MCQFLTFFIVFSNFSKEETINFKEKGLFLRKWIVNKRQTMLISEQAQKVVQVVGFRRKPKYWLNDGTQMPNICCICCAFDVWFWCARGQGVRITTNAICKYIIGVHEPNHLKLFCMPRRRLYFTLIPFHNANSRCFLLH